MLLAVGVDANKPIVMIIVAVFDLGANRPYVYHSSPDILDCDTLWKTVFSSAKNCKAIFIVVKQLLKRDFWFLDKM